MKATADSSGARPATILRLWLPVLIWMAVIFVLSAQPSPPRAPDDLIDTLVKKGAHFGEYLILALLLSRALSAGGATIQGARPIAFALAVAYAISDELHQALVPGRTPSAWDVGIDALGTASGMALFAWWRRAKR